MMSLGGYGDMLGEYGYENYDHVGGGFDYENYVDYGGYNYNPFSFDYNPTGNDQHDFRWYQGDPTYVQYYEESYQGQEFQGSTQFYQDPIEEENHLLEEMLVQFIKKNDCHLADQQNRIANLQNTIENLKVQVELMVQSESQLSMEVCTNEKETNLIKDERESNLDVNLTNEEELEEKEVINEDTNPKAIEVEYEKEKLPREKEDKIDLRYAFIEPCEFVLPLIDLPLKFQEQGMLAIEDFEARRQIKRWMITFSESIGLPYPFCNFIFKFDKGILVEDLDQYILNLRAELNVELKNRKGCG